MYTKNTYGLVPSSRNDRSHNALKYNALAMIALVDGGNGDETIFLIFPCVFSFTQLERGRIKLDQIKSNQLNYQTKQMRIHQF